MKKTFAHRMKSRLPGFPKFAIGGKTLDDIDQVAEPVKHFLPAYSNEVRRVALPFRGRASGPRILTNELQGCVKSPLPSLPQSRLFGQLFLHPFTMEPLLPLLPVYPCTLVPLCPLTLSTFVNLCPCIHLPVVPFVPLVPF